jgi:hypothetical protein
MNPAHPPGPAGWRWAGAAQGGIGLGAPRRRACCLRSAGISHAMVGGDGTLIPSERRVSSLPSGRRAGHPWAAVLCCAVDGSRTGRWWRAGGKGRRRRADDAKPDPTTDSCWRRRRRRRRHHAAPRHPVTTSWHRASTAGGAARWLEPAQARRSLLLAAGTLRAEHPCPAHEGHSPAANAAAVGAWRCPRRRHHQGERAPRHGTDAPPLGVGAGGKACVVAVAVVATAVTVQ